MYVLIVLVPGCMGVCFVLDSGTQGKED